MTIIMRISFKPVLLIALSAALTSLPSWAGDASPIGLWKNLDDVSGKPRALVRITESNGTLQGKIEKVFLAAGEEPNPKCDKCDGALKNTPGRGSCHPEWRDQGWR